MNSDVPPPKFEVKRLLAHRLLSDPASRTQFPPQILHELETQFGEPAGCLLIATESGDVAKIVGTGGFRQAAEHVCEIRRLVVAPTFQRRGIGKMLLESLIHVGRSAGYQLMTVHFPANIRDLVQFYHIMGFHEAQTPALFGGNGLRQMELAL